MSELIPFVTGLVLDKLREVIAKRFSSGEASDVLFFALLQREINKMRDTLDKMNLTSLRTAYDYFWLGLACLEEDQNDQARSKLSDCEKYATEAFNNQALKIDHRVIAMRLRVSAALILHSENIPTACVLAKRLVEQLNQLPEVQKSCEIEFGNSTTIRKYLKQGERRQLLLSVCDINCMVRDFILLANRDDWHAKVQTETAGEVTPMHFYTRIHQKQLESGLRHSFSNVLNLTFTVLPRDGQHMATSAAEIMDKGAFSQTCKLSVAKFHQGNNLCGMQQQDRPKLQLRKSLSFPPPHP